MPRPLSSADLRDLHQILEALGVHNFYRFLSQRHYGFAAWAESVTPAGEAVMSPTDFLRNAALPGICSPIFQILAEAQVDKMRTDLAKAYFRALHRIAKRNAEKTIHRDVDAIEVSDVYREALERNGLSIENWNLYFPLTILRRLGGDRAVDTYWAFLRDSPLRGSPVCDVVNLATIAFMYKQTMSTDTKVRQMASAWLSRNPMIETQDTVESRFNWSLDAVRLSNHQGIADFLGVLDLEAHGIPSDQDRTAGSRCAGPEATAGLVDNAPASLDDWETELESAYIYRALMARLTGAR